jgi:SMI1 / KNR4 family (SUKH-1)
MGLQEAMECLSNLITRSQGNLILLAPDLEWKFSKIKTYSDNDLLDFERTLKVVLPESYKLFLKEIGACEIYINQYDLGVEFKRLEEIEDFATQVLVENASLFPRLLPVAYLSNRGDVAGFDLTREGDNFTVFFHEEPPESWLDEPDDWCSFASWLTTLVQSNGEIDLP